MNAHTKTAIGKSLAELAAKLKPSDSLPILSRYIGIRVGEVHLGLVGENASDFDKVCMAVFQESRVGDKFSEVHVTDTVRTILAQLTINNSQASAEQLLTQLETEYRSYSTQHTAFVPLIGVVMDVPELRIGRVTIRKTTRDDLLRRLGNNARTRMGEGILNTFTDAVLAESVATAEPIRAKEVAIEETRRALDVLRYSIPFLIPKDYKRLDMNVGVAGDFGQGDELALVLPSSNDGSSMTLSSAKERGAFPYHVTTETIRVLRECGALLVSDILAKPLPSVTDFEQVLVRGVHWFANALTQKEPENELLSLTTCLETFLTPRDGNPIGTAIAEGVALLLCSSLEDRKRMKKKVKELYGKRSGVSHGGQKTILEADLTELRDISRRTVREMISLNATIQSQKELLERIEDKKLS